MKRIWIVLIIVALIFGGSFFYMNYLSRICDEMSAYIEDAYDNAANYDAAEFINRADEVLERSSAVLCVFIDQELINDVEDSIILCRERHKSGSEAELKAELVMLREKINHLEQSEKFDFKRIL